TIGSTFVSLLTALVPPLIFLAIVTSIANLREVTNAARLAGKTLPWFAITALISVLVGIGLGAPTDPGASAGVAPAGAEACAPLGGWLEFLPGLVPANFGGLEGSPGDAGAVSLGFNAPQTLVVSIAVGIAVPSVGGKADPFLRVASSGLAI